MLEVVLVNVCSILMEDGDLVFIFEKVMETFDVKVVRYS